MATQGSVEDYLKGLELPSKWDIIPIHASDRSNFKRCRRYWDWSSPARHNLVLRADLFGVNTDLWFGTGTHWALEQYYNPLVRRDPVEAWKTWFDVQWRGGIVTEDWLDRVYDLNPQKELRQKGNWVLDVEPLYKVRGLEDIIPDPDTQEFDDLLELGIGMMTFYKDYASRNDDFEVLTVEHNFSVPIWDYENNCILKAIDTREDSPNQGKLLEVHARGRMDQMQRRISNDKVGLLDSKTASKIGEDYFEKLETDEQITTYLWAAEVEANYYDLPHKGVPLEELIYNTLRKASPKPPTMLKNGMFSVSRTDESTTPALLDEFIRKYMPGIPLSITQQAYVDYVRDIGDEQFVIRKYVTRNRHQIANAGKRAYLEAMDMLENPRIYMNMTNDWLCKKCVFRAPCLAKEDGSDWKFMINEHYTTNRDR